MAVINSYEAVIVVSIKLGEEAVAETVKKFKKLIEKHGTVESVDEWGKRRLAYPTRKQMHIMCFLTSSQMQNSLQNSTELQKSLTAYSVQ